jgi:hypothetical protein
MRMWMVDPKLLLHDLGGGETIIQSDDRSLRTRADLVYASTVNGWKYVTCEPYFFLTQDNDTTRLIV